MPRVGQLITSGGDTIPLMSGELPPGFDTLSPEVQKWVLQATTENMTTDYKPENTGSDNTPMYIFLAVLITGIFFRFRKNLQTDNLDNTSWFDDEEEVNTAPKRRLKEYLTYYGDELKFSDEVLTTVLTKHSHFFNTLGHLGKQRFLLRLKEFMKIKVFNIHDTTGFREMPILISAAAIQLSFGLKKYLLQNFKYIHIYPAEFIGVHPTLRILAGNVSGHSINISWKHFLEGFQYPDDGSNVGLHEMAHAYYYQNFETGEYVDADFVNGFPGFDNCGNKAFEQEKIPGKDFYSEYAMTNFQEFWAESVELFFEKPHQMKTYYPELYGAMNVLLNQDPASTISRSS